MSARVQESIAKIVSTLNDAKDPWILGFSGGKDSTALLLVTIKAMQQVKLHAGFKLVVTYCDTGVEIPTVSAVTQFNLNKILNYAKNTKLPIEIVKAVPEIKNKFFVKIIGRGYVPPTNKFRWCTDRLRIKPVESVIKSYCNEKSLILLGVRKGESLERDKIISKHRKNKYFLKQSATNRIIFAPIISFTTTDVWNVISDDTEVLKKGQFKLLSIYREASGECPLIKDPQGSPCNQGRFGCWTCTVVRQDKSVKSLIDAGNEELIPLLKFRNWLSQVRDDQKFRELKRRNGAPGPGPFTLEARKIILKKLLLPQRESNLVLIQPDEIKAIRSLWKLDQ